MKRGVLVFVAVAALPVAAADPPGFVIWSCMAPPRARIAAAGAANRRGEAAGAVPPRTSGGRRIEPGGEPSGCGGVWSGEVLRRVRGKEVLVAPRAPSTETGHRRC